MSSPMDEASGPCSLLSESARLRENLDQLRKEGRPIKWQRRFEKIAASIEEVLASYEAAIADRTALHQRLKRQAFMLQLLDLDLRWHLQRPPVTPADPSTPSAAGPLSFRVLPLPDGWDQSWERRILMLTSSDLAWLQRDWLQCSALLMYKAELYGPSSFEHQQLRDYAERYAAFNQHLIRLIPLEWRRRSLYNLNTMTLIAQPPDSAWLDQFLTTRCKAKPYLLQAFKEYHKQAAVLREQYAALVRQYAYLAAGRAPGQGWATAPAAPYGAAQAQAATTATTAADSAAAPGAAQVGAGSSRGQATPAPSASAAASTSTVAAGNGRGHAAATSTIRPAFLPLFGPHSAQPPIVLTALGPQQLAIPQQGRVGTISSSATGFPWPIPLLHPASTAGRAQDIILSMDDLLRAIQANLLQQRQVLRQCLFAARFSDDIIEHIRVYLLLYPLAIDIIDFLEAAAEPPMATVS